MRNKPSRNHPNSLFKINMFNLKLLRFGSGDWFGGIFHPLGLTIASADGMVAGGECATRLGEMAFIAACSECYSANMHAIL
jgi:hypothetical protein